MKRLLVLLVLFVSVSLSLQAQYFETEKKKEQQEEKPEVENRVFFGGNFGFSISFGRSESQYLELSPLVGYRFSPDFSAGASFSYLYISREFILLPSFNRVTIKNNTYGPRGFLRYQFLDGYFLQTEYESLNTEVLLNDGTPNTTRAWVPGFFIGGGTSLQIKNGLAFNFIALYNLSYNDVRSPYVSPLVFRSGIILR